MPDTPRETLDQIIEHSGVVTRKRKSVQFASGEIFCDGRPARPGDLPCAGAVIRIQDTDYILTPGGQGRLQLCPNPAPATTITGKIRVHCGYHKCLTEYSKKVYRSTCNSLVQPGGSFRHFFHRLDSLYSDCPQHTINSVSGHALDLERFDDIRIVRFIRDPRDLLISGYYYHKRGAEPWCHLRNPVDIDWMIVNGAVPEQLPPERSLTEFLTDSPLETGLMAEMDFRRHHYASMLDWPKDDPRVKLFRYEDIVGNESRIFREVFDFFQLPWPTRIAGSMYARRYRAGAKASKHKHIRNPTSGQWRQHFTASLKKAFNRRYGDILERYGYPLD